MAENYALTRIIRAPILHTPRNPFRDAGALEWFADGGIVISGGRIAALGDYAEVRGAHLGAESEDLRGGYLLPGFIDTHIHFPQLRVLGGLGEDLPGWLDRFALPEERLMADEAHARRIAEGFVAALAAHGTTTALVFGAHFASATEALFEAAERGGLRLVAGMVLSDRELHPELHQSPDRAYRESTDLIGRHHNRNRALYAVTPRFAVSASEAILEVCQTLAREQEGVRFQSHINENAAEIASVRRLFPWASDYLAVYERYGLVGPGSVLAHNVHGTSDEIARLAASGAAVAHCPCSNAALGSGIFPLRRHVEAGVRCALGTDVGGGTGFGMLREGLQAYLMQRVRPDGWNLTPAQMLYLATRAGAEALLLEHETGDLRPGKSADLVYLKPVPGTPLDFALERAESPEDILAAIFTLGDAAAIQPPPTGPSRANSS